MGLGKYLGTTKGIIKENKRFLSHKYEGLNSSSTIPTGNLRQITSHSILDLLLNSSMEIVSPIPWGTKDVREIN